MDRFVAAAMLGGRWYEPSELTPRDWQLAADRARDKAGRPRLIIPPTHFTTALKIPTSNKVPEGAREVTDGQRIWFHRCDDPREEGAEIYHGAAHVLFVREGTTHNEVDAWGLAAEIAYPSPLALQVQDIAKAMRLQPHAPRWMLEAQIRLVLRQKIDEERASFAKTYQTG